MQVYVPLWLTIGSGWNNRRRVGGRLWAIGVTAWIVATAATSVPAQPALPAQERALQALGEFSRSLQELAEVVRPGDVQIFVTGYAPPGDEDGRRSEPALERSRGSGVMWMRTATS